MPSLIELTGLHSLDLSCNSLGYDVEGLLISSLAHVTELQILGSYYGFIS